MRALALTLLLTTPALPQFQILPSPTTADLRGIHAVSPEIAWASGTNGTVLRTTDAGANWTLCPIPPNAEHLDFRGIQAFDAQTAIVMSSGKGDLSRLYKTTDACATWTLLFTNPDPQGFWDALAFDLRKPYASSSDWREKLHGVLIGDPVNGVFVIYVTADSGNSWSRWGTKKGWRPARANPGESAFAASNSALISPTFDGPFAFVSGGSEGSSLFIPREHSPFDASYWWAFSKKKLPFPRSNSSGAFSVATNGKDLMIVGGDYANPDMPGTSTFIPAFPTFDPVTRPKTPPHGYRSSVAYSATTKTWITVGPNGTDISTDDGRNWRPLKPSPTDRPDTDKNWNALSLPYVVGPHGRIGKLHPNRLTPP